MSKRPDTTYIQAFDGLSVLTQHLDADGDGTGVHNVNGTYTAGTTDGVFFIAPAANEIFYINDLHILIEDTGIQGDQYGGITALTNGMLLQVVRAGAVIANLLGGESIKSNIQWMHMFHDSTMYEFAAGNEALVCSQDFPQSYGGHLALDGSKGDLLRVVAQDTLTGLVEHEYMVQGYKATRRTRT